MASSTISFDHSFLPLKVHLLCFLMIRLSWPRLQVDELLEQWIWAFLFPEYKLECSHLTTHSKSIYHQLKTQYTQLRYTHLHECARVVFLLLFPTTWYHLPHRSLIRRLTRYFIKSKRDDKIAVKLTYILIINKFHKLWHFWYNTNLGNATSFINPVWHVDKREESNVKISIWKMSPDSQPTITVNSSNLASEVTAPLNWLDRIYNIDLWP